jgi:hypothetical protein
MLGSGGSILTVPVLTYLLGHESKVAIAESLAVVGGIALATALPYARAHQVDWRSVLFFGVPGMVGTTVGAWLSKYLSGGLQLTLFAIVMLMAAAMLFRRPVGSGDSQQPHARHSFWQIAAQGLSVGMMTGLVGVGGGFLVVPALVLLGGLSMRIAVGTSLVVIALNSWSGFVRYVDVLESIHASIDWGTIAGFVAIGVVGSFTGRLVAGRISPLALRKAFAVFLVVMGLFVLAKELPGVVRDFGGTRTRHVSATQVDESFHSLTVGSTG